MTVIKATRRKYSPEFKQETVALVTQQGYTVSQAAEVVNVNPTQVRRWKQELEQAANGTRLAEGERSELARLRRENHQLKMEKEILKKASAFFAKEMK